MASVQSIQIRHLDSLRTLEQELQFNPWSQTQLSNCFSNQPPYLLRGISRTSTLKGYYISRLACDTLELLRLGVAKSTQQQGFGCQLLIDLKQQALLHNCANIYLEVGNSNVIAIKLYHSFGFHTVGVRLRYYGHEDALLMTCTLEQNIK